MRRLAETARGLIERLEYLNIAKQYDALAQQAEKLASDKDGGAIR